MAVCISRVRLQSRNFVHLSVHGFRRPSSKLSAACRIGRFILCVCVCGMAASGAQQNLAENYFLSCVREWVGWIGISDAFVALHATHM